MMSHTHSIQWLYYTLFCFPYGFSCMKRQRKAASTNRDEIIITDSPKMQSKQKKSAAMQSLDGLMGKTLIVDTHLLNIGLPCGLDASSTTDVELLKYLCGIAKVCLLVKVDKEEAAADIRRSIMKIFGPSGLESHHVLPYQKVESKKAIVRQMCPQFYIDNDEAAYEYNKRFVPTLVRIGKAKDAASVSEYFSSAYGLIL